MEASLIIIAPGLKVQGIVSGVPMGRFRIAETPLKTNRQYHMTIAPHPEAWDHAEIGEVFGC